ncbi:MAG: UDP-N-acetylmuramoyl-L-alanyl-D-glutamate--2,6-diaminopimelate ligase, partial [Acutalibacteraceae bacterium]|nr:UDP-N-acetylmuramoyl-L-alanyl-D-glutamate--2,6-diaminopimelate ligase [Acutalibacteraceae bacterium]
MKLINLIECSEALADKDITGITCDSRQVKAGFAFVCINGAKADGHDYAEKALENGAAVIVSERDLGLKSQITVPDTHAAYADMCAKWFGNPADSLKLLGVTGTNGKTSVTYMMKKILEKSGYKVGLIGTIQNMIGDEIIAAHNTTPNAYELNSLFALMKAKGCTYVIMEVSSHALDQSRVYRLNFEAAMFTNLTQDHLDYHITMENYLAAKKKLFGMCKTAVINSDDPYSEELVKGLDCRMVTYSLGDSSTYSAKGVN